MSAPFTLPLRVRYHECDPQGIVFNANWLAYCDVAMTDWWRGLFGPWAELTAQGLDLVVAEAALRFRRPARFDEELVLEVTVGEAAATEFRLRTRALRDGEELVVATLRYVAVDTATHRRTALPAAVRERLEGLVAAPGARPAPA